MLAALRPVAVLMIAGRRLGCTSVLALPPDGRPFSVGPTIAGGSGWEIALDSLIMDWSEPLKRAIAANRGCRPPGVPSHSIWLRLLNDAGACNIGGRPEHLFAHGSGEKIELWSAGTQSFI